MTYIEKEKRFEFHYSNYGTANITNELYDFINKKIKNGDGDYIVFENTNSTLEPLRIKHFMKFDDFKANPKDFKFIPNVIIICDYIGGVLKTNHGAIYDYRVCNEILDIFLKHKIKD